MARRRVERDQVPAAVHEDPPLAAVGPRRDAPMNESGAVRRLSRGVRLRIVRPQLGARVRVERDDAIVRRAEKERVAHHQRRRLEVAGARAIGRVRRLTGRPLPRACQLGDVAAVDVGERRILRGAGIAAPRRAIRWPPVRCAGAATAPQSTSERNHLIDRLASANRARCRAPT